MPFLPAKVQKPFYPHSLSKQRLTRAGQQVLMSPIFLPFEISVSTWVCGHFGQNLLPPILDFSTEGLSQNTAFQVQYNVNITCADEIQCMRGFFHSNFNAEINIQLIILQLK